MPPSADHAVADLYQTDWGRILSALIRLTNDFELAEECVQEAFASALTQWREHGVPDHPRAWVIQTAHHKAIDQIRRRVRGREKLDQYAITHDVHAPAPDFDPDQIPDDRLRLIFTCCHPALAPEARIALTLRTLGGLETGEIARAFLVPEPTMAQRLVRAKRKIRDAGIAYEVPSAREIHARLDSVLTVLYLIFNEGYAATRGPLLRRDLCREAIRLTAIVRELAPEDMRHEVTGLLALMLLHDARRDARLDSAGDVILMEDQDRALWNHAQITAAGPLVLEALSVAPTPFALQAAIAFEHCRAQHSSQTDWQRILEIYDFLEQQQPSPVVSLNRAVAVAMVHGPGAALGILSRLGEQGDLNDYHLFHSSRAELLRRSGDNSRAAASYRRALELVVNESERRFLERRLASLDS